MVGTFAGFAGNSVENLTGREVGLLFQQAVAEDLKRMRRKHKTAYRLSPRRYQATLSADDAKQQNYDKADSDSGLPPMGADPYMRKGVGLARRR
jgi:hypothetical protein